MAIIKWIADPAHTEVQFKVKHLMIATVTGYFKKFNLEVETEEADFTKASKILFTADVDSIETNNAQRDIHLKSQDFFAGEQFPQVRFEGKNFERKGTKYLLNGDLTIRDVTKPVTVEVEYSGTVIDPWGQTKAGFAVDGKIKRKDFNLMWDAVTEAGQVVASNEIRIHCDVELVKQVEQTEVREVAAKEAEQV